MDSDRCPCGRPAPYDHCCGVLHAGGRAVTAEQVMRARFSAFARGDAAYLARSWHSSTAPASIRIDAEQVWTRLEVTARAAGGMLDQHGTVAFEAHWRRGDRTGVLGELSEFAREAGEWVYVGPVG